MAIRFGACKMRRLNRALEYLTRLLMISRQLDFVRIVKIKSLSRFFPRFVITKALKETSFQEQKYCDNVGLKPRQKTFAVEI